MASFRKVLIITYDFYPDNSPNTYRWFNIAKNWQEKGVQVFVIAANKNQFPPYEEVNGIKIYRTGEYAIGNLKYSFDMQNNIAAIPVKKNFIRPKQMLIKLLRKIYNLTWSKLYWPDYAFLWKYSAYPAAKRLIQEEQIEKIITVSWMFTAHTIGLKLKENFKQLFWLAATVDPFSFNSKINNISIYTNQNEAIERKVFLNADLNSVLTERIKEEYILKFPEATKKIVVNKNVFLPINSNLTNKSEKKGIINLVFVGTLSEETRPPENLLALFNNLTLKYPQTQFELNFYGDFTNCLPTLLAAEGINKTVFLNSRKSKAEINVILNEADVLVNIGNSNKYQEPSKVIEYMYSGKKILNVCTINEDTSANLLKIYPLHLNVFPDALDLSTTLQCVFEFLNREMIIEKEVIDNILNDYLLNNVADKYYKYVFES